MFIRITEGKKGMCVNVGIPMKDKIAISHIIPKIKSIRIETVSEAASPTGYAALVCNKAKGKPFALPFEVLLIDKEVLRKHKDDFEYRPRKDFNVNSAMDMTIVVHKRSIDFIKQYYKDQIPVIDIKEVKDAKDLSEKILEAVFGKKKESSVDLTEDDWKKLDEQKSE